MGEDVARQIVSDKKIKSVKVQERDQNQVKVRAYVTDDIRYYDADAEKNFIVAESSVQLDGNGQFVDTRVAARRQGEPSFVHVRDLTHMDISPKQIVSVTTSLIPFLEHD